MKGKRTPLVNILTRLIVTDNPVTRAVTREIAINRVIAVLRYSPEHAERWVRQFEKDGLEARGIKVSQK